MEGWNEGEEKESRREKEGNGRQGERHGEEKEGMGG